jgi:hypothetical protein
MLSLMRRRVPSGAAQTQGRSLSERASERSQAPLPVRSGARIQCALSQTGVWIRSPARELMRRLRYSTHCIACEVLLKCGYFCSCGKAHQSSEAQWI